jgi:hypothetical protein
MENTTGSIGFVRDVKTKKPLVSNIVFSSDMTEECPILANVK